MQVEAIHGHDRPEFTTPSRLGRDRIRTIIDMPDETLEGVQSTHVLSGEVHRMAEEMRRKTEEMLNAPFPPHEALPKLTEKQRERMEAFALREDR
uniref:Uncharacterized protein n=1 Tax=Candidatus Kentrum sp. FM TaxID=2126340 RepID=A0A450SRP5_9GAMM|nr:MAG: hypothetical protein BECKFM1743A_GA0114220_101724 [Candidatus Kentron sp. FM]VFJ56640.1 MAG: hypothetical protein BECKFM1743C_GA0114222_101814 [Candidatus Kentron sp. FM]VFK11190.1 MAG: hypothetical protein BECKFM1743B_GA0114221_101714 [Candidatus Kentron sp. FM]